MTCFRTYLFFCPCLETEIRYFYFSLFSVFVFAPSFPLAHYIVAKYSGLN